jgi:23S rRNA pseudouridine1911/1915/1917 synthase
VKSGTTPAIRFQDKSFLVLNKPSGVVVDETLQKWLRDNFQFSIFKPEGSSSAYFNEYRSGIVHRLDKETSGLLLIAKTKEAFLNLQRQFKERKVEKKYIALVHGKLEPEEGIVDIAIGRLPWNRERFGVLPGGRSSETKYRVKKYFDGYTLVGLWPKTGRTHQIRVHMKYLGHPIVSDSFYAGRKTSRRDREWCPRLFLHAEEISFYIRKLGRESSLELKCQKTLDWLLKIFRI